MIVRGTLESVDAGMGLTLTGVIFENLEVDGTILCTPLAALSHASPPGRSSPPLCLPHYRLLPGPHDRLPAVQTCASGTLCACFASWQVQKEKQELEQIHVRGSAIRYVHVPGRLDPNAAILSHRRRLAEAAALQRRQHDAAQAAAAALAASVTSG